MLHNDINLSRLMVYAQSIEESKHSSILRNLKRSKSNHQNKPRSKNRALNHDEPSATKVKGEVCSVSLGGKHTFITCGKKYFGKCLVGTGNFFDGGKDVHKVRDCPTISARGKEGRQDPLSVPEGGAPKEKTRLYALRSRELKPDENNYIGKLYLLSYSCYEFLLSREL